MRNVLEVLPLSRSTLVAEFLDLPGIANLAAAAAMNWQVNNEDELAAAISSAAVSEHQEEDSREEQIAALLSASAEAEAIHDEPEEFVGHSKFASSSAGGDSYSRRYSDSDDLSDTSSLPSDSTPYTTPSYSAERQSTSVTSLSNQTPDDMDPLPTQDRNAMNELHFGSIAPSIPASYKKNDSLSWEYVAR